jgi:cell division protein FtsB
MPSKGSRKSKKPKQRVRVAHRSEGKPVSKGIRWDRLPGNWLIVILLVMGALYVPPVKGYYEQRKATSEAKSHLQDMGKENRALRARARSLKKESTIALEARKLGMVAPDERPFVILK